MKSNIKPLVMARQSKYSIPVLKMLTREFVSTNFVRKRMMVESGKMILWLQIEKILNNHLKDKKVEKKEIRLSKQKIYLWRIAKEKTLKS